MSCKPFKTTEANAKSFLRTKGAIDKFLNIIDLNKFRQFHGELINQAKKYIPNFSDKLFYEEQGGKKAVPNTKVFNKIDEVKRVNSKSKEITYQKNQTISNDGIIASEKTIRDLAARISDRIGIPIKFESDRSKEYKGKIENGTAYINLAYATLDTPIHEILAHPIIRAIKNKQSVTKRFVANFNKRFFDNQDEKIDTGKTIKHEGYVYNVYKLKKYSNVEYKAYNFQRNEQIELSEEEFKNITKDSELYQSLLKELETGRGKEVFEQVKRDYKYKEFNKEEVNKLKLEINDFENDLEIFKDNSTYLQRTKEKIRENQERIKYLQKNNSNYTLEEQQEEALVELMSLMVADKLNKITDKNLISLLKQLLKQINDFIKSLLNTKELNINDIEADNIKFLIENKLKELIKNGTIKKEC